MKRTRTQILERTEREPCDPSCCPFGKFVD